MQDIYAVVEGDFGKVVVIEVMQNLVPHAHEQIQLGYWLSGGSACCHVGDETVLLNDGVVAACNSYQSHDMVLINATEPVIGLFLYINVAWLDDLEPVWKTPIHFTSAKITETPEIRETSNALMRKILFPIKGATLCIETDVVKLLQLTVKQSIDQPKHVPRSIRRRMPDYRLRLALSYMKENVIHLALMDELAQMIGVSRSRLYELFLNELKSSLKVVWNSMRTDEAKKRMALNDDSLADVAASLGFSSPGNFSRFFKANTGVSPLIYKKTINALKRKTFSKASPSVSLAGHIQI